MIKKFKNIIREMYRQMRGIGIKRFPASGFLRTITLKPRKHLLVHAGQPVGNTFGRCCFEVIITAVFFLEADQHLAHEIVARNQRTGNGEFYVSGAYNAMIAEGLAVGIVDVAQYWSMGTPEELAGALVTPDFIMHVNRLKKALTGAPR